MFIIQLRGRVGVKIQLVFFLLTMVSFLALYFAHEYRYELLAGLATLVSFYLQFGSYARIPESWSLPKALVKT